MSNRILLIEDEQDIREAMAEGLTESGFEVMTASNGAEGLQLALTEKPDVILLDIIMPEMDGHEMLKKLRTDPWGNKAKVIMLTSMDNAAHVANSYTDSVDDYIIKVHNSLDEIVNKVKVVLNS